MRDDKLKVQLLNEKNKKRGIQKEPHHQKVEAEIDFEFKLLPFPSEDKYLKLA